MNPPELSKPPKNAPEIPEDREEDSEKDSESNETSESNLEKFIVPQRILKNKHYNPELMQEVIYRIATTDTPVAKIAEELGVNQSNLYMWRSISPQIKDAWRIAMESRTHALKDKFEEEAYKIDEMCDNEEMDPRTQTVKLKGFDVKWKHHEWFMSRANRTDFGDQMTVDNNVTISAADAREQAWEKAQQLKDAKYEIVDNKDRTNRAQNTDLSPIVPPSG